MDTGKQTESTRMKTTLTQTRWKTKTTFDDNVTNPKEHN